MRYHTGTDVSNLLLAMNSENVNLSLQSLATPLSQLIIPFGGLLNNFR